MKCSIAARLTAVGRSLKKNIPECIGVGDFALLRCGEFVLFLWGPTPQLELWAGCISYLEGELAKSFPQTAPPCCPRTHPRVTRSVPQAP